MKSVRHARSVLLVLLASWVIWPQLTAQSARILPLDSPLYEQIDMLSTLAGKDKPLAVRPWTIGQARFYFNQIQVGELDPRARSLYEHIQDTLDSESNRSTPVSVQVVPGLELHGKTNEQLPHEFGHDDRVPLISLPSGIYLGDNLAFEADFALGQDPTTIDTTGTVSNIIPDFSYYDFSMPHRTYGSVQGTNWAAAIARDKLTVGVGQNSHLIVSDAPHFLDRLQLSLFFEVFQYSFVIAYFEPWLTEAEETGSTYWEHSPNGGTAEDYEPSKYLSLHRFDFRPWPWLTVSLTEGLMYGGKYPDLRLLNPLQIFHSFYEWEHSASLFSLEASLTPIRGLNVYGQFMFNQIQSAYEVEHYGADAIPNARGWRAGLGYTLPLGPGFLGLQAEYTHTDPWLYIRENPYITYSWRRKVTSNVNGSVLVTLPLGFEHGPDNNVFWASASFSVPGLGSARIVGEHRVQGENTILTPYDEGPEPASEGTPSGKAIEHLRLGLEAEAQLFGFVEVGLGLGVSSAGGESSDKEIGFEWRVGVQAELVSLLKRILEQ